MITWTADYIAVRHVTSAIYSRYNSLLFCLPSPPKSSRCTQFGQVTFGAWSLCADNFLSSNHHQTLCQTTAKLQWGHRSQVSQVTVFLTKHWQHLSHFHCIIIHYTFLQYSRSSLNQQGMSFIIFFSLKAGQNFPPTLLVENFWKFQIYL